MSTYETDRLAGTIEQGSVCTVRSLPRQLSLYEGQ